MTPPPRDAATPLRWSDALRLGEPSIDAGHEDFVRALQALRDAPDAALPTALATFTDHARAHFAEEDAAMEASAFPPRGCHRDEHAAVLASSVEVAGLLARGNTAVVRRFADEVAAWFPRHLQHLDSALAAWLCARRFGARPLVLRRDLAGAGGANATPSKETA